MDIWSWLERLADDLHESGMQRASELIYQLPSWVNDEENEQVEAALPEAISIARSLKNPWLEVYFRHWGMRLRLSNYGEGQKALDEAISLIEFAHRDETHQCPQSICVTQDVSSVYGNIDGFGYAEDRLAICAETLAKIDPTWPCFDCISREYADALCDAGKYQEAINYIDQQQAAMRHVGEQPSTRMNHVKIYAHRQLGDYDTALNLLDAIEKEDAEDPSVIDINYRAVLRARLLALKGLDQAALEILPPWSKILPFNYLSWLGAIEVLVDHQAIPNDWQLGSLIQKILTHQIEVGAYRNTITVADVHARFAMQRGATHIAQMAISHAQRALLNLRLPGSAPAIIQRLQALLDTAERVTMPSLSADEIPQWLESQEEKNPEHHLELLNEAILQSPNNEDLHLWLSSAYFACGLKQEAQDCLWAYVEAHPEKDGAIAFRLLDYIVDAQNESDLQRLISLTHAHQPILVSWAKLRFAYRQKRWADVMVHAETILAINPNLLNTRRFYADAALRSGAATIALTQRQAVLSLSADAVDVGDRWNLIVAASAAQDWSVVREQSQILNIDLAGTDGVVEEDFGYVRILVNDPKQQNEYYAIRTGPTTARIINLGRIKQPQHMHAWVVFDPSGLESPPERLSDEASSSEASSDVDSTQDDDFIQLYQACYTLQESPLSPTWALDGAHPGEALFKSFIETLDQDGWVCHVPNQEDYVVTAPNTKEPIAGCYLLVAHPLTMTALEAHNYLKSLTSAWPHPICWLHLAEAAKCEVEKHWQIIEDYELR